MQIRENLRELGELNISPLADAIESFPPSAWTEEQVRQKRYAEVHYNTESVIMVFCDHDKWPAVDVFKAAGWELLQEAALPLMHEIIENCYLRGGTIIRAMAAKLKAGTNIRTHTDAHDSFRCSHRIHIPITTNTSVRFFIDGRPHQLEVGKAYEVNNQKRHGVMNGGISDRITFIFDYLPPAGAVVSQ